MLARTRYQQLATIRTPFLDIAVQASLLTLPYLIKQDIYGPNWKNIKTPWQSVGAKGVVNLASKLMLALLPPQTTFFKLQVRDDKLGEELEPIVRSELDLSFSKIEKLVMQYIDASSDRVVLHEAVKNLVVGGNALLYMGPKNMKFFPLNRFVVNRDGDGNVIEIVTKELISKEVLGLDLPELETKEPRPNSPASPKSGLPGLDEDDVEVYTYAKLDEKAGRWVWHQEVLDKIVPGSRSTAPKSVSPWLPLRFNTVDGEDYGRGRVEEFLGDLKSLEALSKALVEGSAAAAKVIFLVSPSSTTKPQTIAQADNGAIVQGRPDDVAVVQVAKQADFSTAMNMAERIERRLADAFLILQVRDSERTSAEEVRLTQLELEQQLGGLFGLLTVEFLVPYLNRTLLVLERSKQLPKIPKDLVRPQIVAGVNALGRGEDEKSLTQFITTITQTVGPEIAIQYLNPEEYLRRLAAAQGIDTLNLIKTKQQMDEEMQAAQQSAMTQDLTKQAGQLSKSPLMDPTKNPAVMNMMDGNSENPNPTEPANQITAGASTGGNIEAGGTVD
jgi:hypothetical protein